MAINNYINYMLGQSNLAEYAQENPKQEYERNAIMRHQEALMRKQLDAMNVANYPQKYAMDSDDVKRVALTSVTPITNPVLLLL